MKEGKESANRGSGTDRSFSTVGSVKFTLLNLRHVRSLW
jgi:hypothetical protein